MVKNHCTKWPAKYFELGNESGNPGRMCIYAYISADKFSCTLFGVNKQSQLMWQSRNARATNCSRPTNLALTAFIARAYPPKPFPL